MGNTKKFTKTLLKILKWIAIILVFLIILILIVRLIGRKIYSKAPEGGISEEMYVDINGQKQWISIYGESKDNPVLLYLHGGPGFSTSFLDWEILQKLADDYTVVNWDQRNSGKTLMKDKQDTEPTAELMKSDLLSLTNYLLEYMDKDKLTIMGMSWGTTYGCTFAYEHPELVECVISLSHTISALECDRIQKKLFLEFSADDPEYHALAEKIELSEDRLSENQKIIDELSEKYSDKLEETASEDSGGDINMARAIFFNPYYSLSDYFKFFKNGVLEDSANYYEDFSSDVNGFEKFSLSDRTDYKMPVYILEGKSDVLYEATEEYYRKITAPDKELQSVKGGHTSTMLHSEELNDFVHKIAEKQNAAR